MLLLFTLLPNLEFNPCPAALNKSQRRGGGVQQAGLSGWKGLSRPPCPVSFFLQSDTGSARTGVLKVPASEESSQGDCKEALFAPMPVSGPLPSKNPHFHTASLFVCPSFSLFLQPPLPATTSLFPLSAFSSFLLPLLPTLFPLVPFSFLSSSSFPLPHSPKPLFQDNRADGRLFVLYVPLENQLRC